MTRPTLTAPTCRGEQMLSYAVSPPAQQWRLRVTLGLTVIVTRRPHWETLDKAQRYVTTWRIEGLDGCREEHPVKGGPQKAANAAGEVLDALRKRIAGMGRAA